MEPDNDLRQEIHHELRKLHYTVTELHHEQADPAAIERTTQPFQDDLLIRLAREQQAELRGRRIGIEAAMEMQAGPQNDIESVPDQALIAKTLMEKTAEAVRDNYRQLRYDCVKSLRNIEAGRAPDFPLEPEKQPDKTRSRQFDPEELKDAQARVRPTGTKRLEADKEMER